jgi:hypothetical protein
MRRTLLCGLSLAALGLAPAQASVLLGFDGVAPGTAANTFAPANLTFQHAVLDFAYDVVTGDPIPGTEQWRPDPTAPEVIVENPAAYGRGAAPSPANALNALGQPVLMQFSGAFDLVSFGVTLDNDAFGDNGNLPGFEDVAIRFLDLSGAIVGSIPVDQTQPGFQVLGGPVSGVRGILLPAGAFYDNLTWSPVPEPGAWAIVAGLGGLAFALYRRKGWLQARG